MSMHAKAEKCQKQTQCVCSQLSELSKLYDDLRCLRKKAATKDKSRNVVEPSLQFQINESEAKTIESLICPASLSSFRQQRDQVHGLVAALRELNERVARHEEESCQLGKEIADLQAQLSETERRIKEKNSSNADTMKKTRERIDNDDSVWYDTVTAERSEQAHFLAKMNEMNNEFEKRKANDKVENERRQEQRKLNAQLLLNAIEFIDRHVKDSKSLMERKACH